jgi:hypothetical protein
VPQAFDPSKPFTLAKGFDAAQPFTPAPEPQAPEEDSAVSRFAQGAWSNLNPMGLVHAAMDPKAAVKGLLDAHAAQLDKAKAAYSDGHYSEAAGHLAAAALPLIGPAAAHAGERIGEGDIAGGLGESAGLLAPFARNPIGRAANLADQGAASAVRAVANVPRAIAESPMTARIAPRLVKYGTTAVGGAVGGWPGAIVGREVGADLADTLATRMARPAAPPPPTPAAQALTAGLSSGEPMQAAKFLELLKQVPPNERPAILAARQQAIQASRAGMATAPPPASVETPPQAPGVSAPGGVRPAPPVLDPVAQAIRDQTAAPPAPAPAPPPAPFNPNVGLKQANEAFAAAGETALKGEAANAMSLIKRGKTPEEAIRIVMGNRPAAAPVAPVDPAAELARRLGTPSEAERIAAQDLRNAQGKVKTPSAETARAMKAAPSALDQQFPKAGPMTDGRLVGKSVPNQDSIEASLTNYETLPGIRQVDMASMDPNYQVKPYSVSEQKRLDTLVETMKSSNRIDPLIVVIDKEAHPYILEGGHRYDALRVMGAKSFPAKIVIDRDSLPVK